MQPKNIAAQPEPFTNMQSSQTNRTAGPTAQSNSNAPSIRHGPEQFHPTATSAVQLNPIQLNPSQANTQLNPIQLIPMHSPAASTNARPLLADPHLNHNLNPNPNPNSDLNPNHLNPNPNSDSNLNHLNSNPNSNPNPNPNPSVNQNNEESDMDDVLQGITTIVPPHNKEDPWECEDTIYDMQELPLRQSLEIEDPSEHYSAFSPPRDPNLDIPADSVTSSPFAECIAEAEAYAAEMERQEQLDAIQSATSEEEELIRQFTQENVAVMSEAEQIQTEQDHDFISPTVRQSERLRGKSPIKTYSVRRKKVSRALEAGEASVKAGLHNSDLARSLQVDNLEASPMQEGLASEIDAYCGVIPVNLDATMAMVAKEHPNPATQDNEVQEDGGVQEQGDGYDGTQGEESILGALEFDSQDDMSDEDGEGESG